MKLVLLDEVDNLKTNLPPIPRQKRTLHEKPYFLFPNVLK